MRCTRHLSALIGALGFSVLAGPIAQADPPSQPPHAAMQGGHDEADMRQRRQAHIDQLASLVHDALALRPDQEASWRTFTASMTPPATMMQHGVEAQDYAMTLTAPQMLDRMAEHMGREQVEFARHAAAVRQFYAVLSPTQKRTFDALMVLMHHRMGMHTMGGMEMRDMHDNDDGSMMH